MRIAGREENTILDTSDLERAAMDMLHSVRIGKKQIYIIWGIGSGMVKIGRSVNPHNRITQIQINCPFKLITLAIFPEISGLNEHQLQKALKHLKTESNGEWFTMGDEVIDIVNIANTGYVNQRSQKVKDYIESIESLH
jgi:hypothetical protein